MPELYGKARNGVVLFFSGLLFLAGLYGAVFSLRASVSQTAYHACKYGVFRGTQFCTPPESAGENLWNQCYKSSLHYPYNYYFFSYAARCAFDAALRSADLELFDELMDKADFFSARAVSLNPYDEGSRDIRVRVIAETDSVDGAISYWQSEVVDKEPWSSVNRNMLAQLYLRSQADGSFSNAVMQLPFVSDASIRKRLNSVRDRLNKKKSQ